MNALVKPRVEDSTGDSLRASRSSSIARRLHQRLGTVEAKRHHKDGAKQGTAAWKKSGDGQCCSHSPAEKRPDRRLFPLRRGFAHHKVRVQDAKLDRLDALDGRRRVREAVQRRHRKKRSGLPSTLSFRCFPGCSLALSALAALSRATQGFSHVRARVHAQGPRCRREEEEGRARESEMPCFFCLFFCCLSLSLSSRRWAAEVNRGWLSGIALGTDGATHKKTSAVKKHEGSAFSSSPRRCKRALRVPFSSQGPLLYRLPALPERDGGSESIFVEKFARKRRLSIVFFPALSPIPSSFFARPPSSSRGEHAPLLCLLTALSLPDPRRQHNGRPRAHDPAPGGPHRARGAVLGAPRLERAVAGRRRRGGAALRAGPARGAGPAGGREGAAAASDAGRRGAAHPWLRRVERRSGESFLPFSFFEFSLCLSFPLLKNTLFLFPFPPDSFPPKSTLFSSSSSTALWDASEGAAGGPQCWAGPGSRGSGPRTRGVCPW